MIVDINSLLEKLKESHPDKMILDHVDDFTRGKLAGHIEMILEIEKILEEEEDGNRSQS